MLLIYLMLRIRIGPLLQNHVGDLMVHILASQELKRLETTALFIYVVFVVVFVVCANRFAVFVSVWCICHADIAILSH